MAEKNIQIESNNDPLVELLLNKKGGDDSILSFLNIILKSQNRYIDIIISPNSMFEVYEYKDKNYYDTPFEDNEAVFDLGIQTITEVFEVKDKQWFGNDIKELGKNLNINKYTDIYEHIRITKYEDINMFMFKLIKVENKCKRYEECCKILKELKIKSENELVNLLKLNETELKRCEQTIHQMCIDCGINVV